MHHSADSEIRTELELEKRLTEIMIEEKSASIAYLVNYKDKEFEGVVGLDDMDMIYRVASISKTITATAAMLLVERGKLDIEQRVDHYLDYEIVNPHFPKKDIKIKHLMNHTSTLLDYYLELSAIGEDGFNEYHRLRDIFSEDGKLYNPKKTWGNVAEPGSSDSFNYSNLNSILLAAIVERISGERFDKLCKKNIFIPLKMPDTTFNIMDIEEADEDCAPLYRTFDFETERGEIAYSTYERQQQLTTNGFFKDGEISEGYEIGEMTAFFGPQGNLHSTLHDLRKFADSFRTRKGLLKKETIGKMEEISWKGFSLDGLYTKKGLNLHILENYPIEGFDLYGHSGVAYGILSEMYYDPERDLTIVFFINGYHSNLIDGFEALEMKVFKTFEALLKKM